MIEPQNSFWEHFLSMLYLTSASIIGFAIWLLFKGLKIITPRAVQGAIDITVVWLFNRFKPLFSSYFKEQIAEVQKEQQTQLSEFKEYLHQAIHGKDNEIAARDGVINISNEAMREALNLAEKLRGISEKN